MSRLSKIIGGIGKAVAPLALIGLVSCAPKIPQPQELAYKAGIPQPQIELIYRTGTVLEEQVTTEFTYSKIIDQTLKNSGIATAEKSTMSAGEVRAYHLKVHFDDGTEDSFSVENFNPVSFYNYLADFSNDIKPGSRVKLLVAKKEVFSDGQKNFVSFYPEGKYEDGSKYINSDMISAEDK